jgi:hypothetical protein
LSLPLLLFFYLFRFREWIVAERVAVVGLARMLEPDGDVAGLPAFSPAGSAGIDSVDSAAGVTEVAASCMLS